MKKMKRIVFMFLMLLITVTTVGQINTIDKPPKKTWKILIKNSKNKESNFQLIGQTIIDNDFSIEKKDFDYLTFETTPKTTDKNTSSYYLKFIAKDNLIVLTGMAKSLIEMNIGSVTLNNEYTKIKNIGMNGSITKDQFNSMLKFAKLFSSNESTFEFVVE